MGDFSTLRLNEEDLTSPSSDERMDTGSESFLSQDTSSSENDEREVLRLQNPDKKQFLERNDSLVSKMAKLKIESPKVDRPMNLGYSPPKFSSTLTLTTDHPLMGLTSPDENYPDLIPKKVPRLDDEKDLSLSSIEDDRLNDRFYTPQRNTSKNNLYFTENFVTADSHLLNDSLVFTTPDVTRVEKLERRMIVKKLEETPVKDDGNDSAMYNNYVQKNTSHSNPKNSAIDINKVAEWCESPSQLRSMPNFELPIEMSSTIGMNNDLDTPDVISSSTQEDKSAYQALLDPYTGRVALCPTQPKSHNTQRRLIKLPPEDDSSLDSLSICSMESDEDLRQHADAKDLGCVQSLKDDKILSDEEDTKRSKSTITMSECSDPIPEYSAAEEFDNERAWIAVPRPTGGHANCDMKVIEPYKRVLSHGGYDGRGAALIVFSACHLPDNSRTDYAYVMDNLFLYVMWTLERLVTEEYVAVYLHGSAGRGRLPPCRWLHRCYTLVDHRLRKSLKHLYLVHPTFWLKSFVVITKPFVSSKFHKKLSYVRNLRELMQKVPVEPNAIPDLVKQYDMTRQ